MFSKETVDNIEKMASIPNHRDKLFQKVEQVKIALSSYDEAYFSLEEYGEDGEVKITREDFEECIKSPLERTMEVVKRCLNKVNIELTNEDGIVLVGGSSQIPLVEKLLREHFPRANISKTVDVNEVVSQGACLKACQEHAKENRQYFSNLQATARMFTPYQIYYSFDNNPTVLLVDQNTSFDQILYVTIPVPVTNATMHLWQMMDIEDPNTGEERPTYVWFGDVDLSKYAGQRIPVRIEIDNCGEMKIQLQSSNDLTDLPIQYGCVMTEDEKNKFHCLTRVLSKVEEGLTLINEMDNPPEDAENYFMEIKKQATDYLFKHVAEVNGVVTFWSSDLQRHFDGLFQALETYINQLKAIFQR